MASVNYCVTCGDIIPEGRQICWGCEHEGVPSNKKPIDIPRIEKIQHKQRIFDDGITRTGKHKSKKKR